MDTTPTPWPFVAGAEYVDAVAAATEAHACACMVEAELGRARRAANGDDDTIREAVQSARQWAREALMSAGLAAVHASRASGPRARYAVDAADRALASATQALTFQARADAYLDYCELTLTEE